MDSLELNVALQQIGMLSESAVVGKDEPRKIKTAKHEPAPIKSIPVYSSSGEVVKRRRKGKHRKPKPNPQVSQPANNNNSNSNKSSGSESGDSSDGDYFYPPEPTTTNHNKRSESEFDDEDMQLALQLSSIEYNNHESLDHDHDVSDNAELIADQCKYRVNIFPIQKVMVQEDKDTSRSHTKGHVWEIITQKDYHLRGLKVRLMSGDTGRVKTIFLDTEKTN